MFPFNLFNDKLVYINKYELILNVKFLVNGFIFR